MRTRQEKVVVAGDGTRLYARQTAGPKAAGVPMICFNGIGVSTIFWHHVEERFSRDRPVICFDYRGHGESEFPRDLDGLTMEANADDGARVLDAFGHDEAILLGHSMGCQVIYTFAHRRPQRTAMLVPMLGTYGHPVHTFLDTEVSALAAFVVGRRVGLVGADLVTWVKSRLMGKDLTRRVMAWGARVAGIVDSRMPDADLHAYLNHMAVLSPLVFLRMAEHMASHSAGPWLPSIAAPTLVVAGERDVFTPLWCSEQIARELPCSKLFVLKAGSHAALVEQPQAIEEALVAFLGEHDVDGRRTAPASGATPVTSAA
jgi:pimeloyl-ACP methyl ester carboxylesterase